MVIYQAIVIPFSLYIVNTTS